MEQDERDELYASNVEAGENAIRIHKENGFSYEDDPGYFDYWNAHNEYYRSNIGISTQDLAAQMSSVRGRGVISSALPV